MKKWLVVFSLLIMLFFTSSIPMAAHAASQTSHSALRPAGQVPVMWNEYNGCTLAQVSLFSSTGSGRWYCFWLNSPNSWGYLGLGDAGGPGNQSNVYALNDPYAGPGWIRYYGGRYPNGTFCRFSNNQYLSFSPRVYVTQIALNVPSSYHQCP